MLFRERIGIGGPQNLTLSEPSPLNQINDLDLGVFACVA
jgi:hypothetical protein